MPVAPLLPKRSSLRYVDQETSIEARFTGCEHGKEELHLFLYFRKGKDRFSYEGRTGEELTPTDSRKSTRPTMLHACCHKEEEKHL